VEVVSAVRAVSGAVVADESSLISK